MYQKDKQALKLLKLYRYGSVLLLFVLFVVGGYIFWSQQARDTSNEMLGLLERIEQLELENEILGSWSSNIQERLMKEKVFTVQFMASSNKEIMLFQSILSTLGAILWRNTMPTLLGIFLRKKRPKPFVKN